MNLPSFDAVQLLSFSLLSFFPYIIATISVIILLFFARQIWSTRTFLIQKKIFLEITPPAWTEKTAYTTQQLFSVLHAVGTQRSFIDKFIGKKILFSFEIVSTKEQGIRYIIQTTDDEAAIVQKTLRSYLPFVHVKEVSDYIKETKNARTIEFQLKNHFAFPLAKQNVLHEHDPVAYITGMMTKLHPHEMIAFQIVVSPTKKPEMNVLSKKILNNEDVLQQLRDAGIPWVFKPFIVAINALLKVIQFLVWEVIDTVSAPTRSTPVPVPTSQYRGQAIKPDRPARVLSTFEQEIVSSISEKVDQLLFETTIRVLVQVRDKSDQKQRLRGIKSSFAPFSVLNYQSLKAKREFPLQITDKLRFFSFRNRLLSSYINRSSSVLSVSEIADLYHFPYTPTTKTENIARSLSRVLPAPLSLKKDRQLAVIFGENMYGGTTTPIGLTKEERETHMYIIGRTGSGKTTLLFSMAHNDTLNGQGIAFIDPHGDISEDLLASIPQARKDDVIYLNPIDLKYPIGINLLELTPGLSDDEAELEKEIVCEGVISLFRKVFSKEETSYAHRIEYILRNTIYTAFTVQDATLFTLFDLLNNPPFRKQITDRLTDKNLKNFWKFEFGRAGDYQAVKMAGGVTAKVGRFLFSPTAKRILEQKRSTINFDDIMNQGKILLCNFSQGNLGEDTMRLLGTTILAKIQQAALKRAKLSKDRRKPFYLYVDEFQNFATLSFTKMLSEGRKYGLSVTIAEQTTSQQDDRNITNIILANVTTVVCFRSANFVDEQLMLTQFTPYVEKGDIANLPRYQFYIKISAIEPEEPFSGKTIYIPNEKNHTTMQQLIMTSRENYAHEYTVQPKSINLQIEIKKEDPKAKSVATPKSGLPNTP